MIREGYKKDAAKIKEKTKEENTERKSIQRIPEGCEDKEL